MKDSSYLIAANLVKTKRIAALRAIRVAINMPRGHNCQTQVIWRNRTLLLKLNSTQGGLPISILQDSFVRDINHYKNKAIWKDVLLSHPLVKNDKSTTVKYFM